MIVTKCLLFKASEFGFFTCEDMLHVSLQEALGSCSLLLSLTANMVVNLSKNNFAYFPQRNGVYGLSGIRK